MFPMNDKIPITNATMELAECRDKWFFDEKYDCWCLEDVLYTPKACVMHPGIFRPGRHRRGRFIGIITF